MVIMAEGNAGVIFMSEVSKPHRDPLTVSGVGVRNGIITSVAGTDSVITSDEMDSDSEPPISMYMMRPYSPTETKQRNKRKNFQPRNIAYSEEMDDQNEKEKISKNYEPVGDEEEEEILEKRRHSSSGSTTSEYALDLSSNDVIVPNTNNNINISNKNTNKIKLIAVDNNNEVPPKKKLLLDENCSKKILINNEENSKKFDQNENHHPRVPSPIDLSYNSNAAIIQGGNKNNNSSYYGDSDSAEESEKPAANNKFPQIPPYFLHHPFFSQQPHQPVDAGDLKEYARNTVKELLEIYGLNSDAVTDVTQTITNNLPISNFNPGKILESLSSGSCSNVLTSMTGGLKRTPSESGAGVSSFVDNNSNSTKNSSSVETFSSSPQPPCSPLFSPCSPTISNRSSITPPLSLSFSTSAAATQTNTTKQKMLEFSFPPSTNKQIITSNIGGGQSSTLLSNQMNSKMVLPQNMAAILALANMKEQMKIASNGGQPVVISAADFRTSLSTAGIPLSSSSVTTKITPAHNENSNSGGICLSRVSLGSPPLLKDKSLISSGSHVDYSRYVKRYGTALECGYSYCKDLNYREHFHCLDCNSRVFIKKEEMIRHFKWHKKRDESLQHGFMRYSPSDDCSDRFLNCTHNRKQTHYHCIQGTCDKVYISTSDVQMHANYHRKDSAIIQEGFQRLRATEECRTPYCAFFRQRTTHFHCRRDQCQFTFKNKADMEKHKTYHIKDEQLARDGFKKFLKPDPCGYTNCKFSQVCNHIHCVREGCSYVLHSSGQLLSHKRKHERKDTEIAYRKFKLSQQSMGNFTNTDQLSQHSESAALSPNSSIHNMLQQATGSSFASSGAFPMLHDTFSNSSSDGEGGAGDCLSPSNSIKSHLRSLSVSISNTGNGGGASTPSNNTITTTPVSLTGGYFTENSSPMDFSVSEDGVDSWMRYINHYEAQETCLLGLKCMFRDTEHYHCRESNCELPFRGKDVAESHAKMHDAQERLTDTLYQEETSLCQEGNCPREKHYHCTWDGCYEAILPNERLDHLRNHEISTSQYNSLDALFRRKRGRPPKNRIIEVWNDYGGISGNDSPQAIFTSFKLPKPSVIDFPIRTQSEGDAQCRSPSPRSRTHSPKHHLSLQFLEEHKFEDYTDGCPDYLCSYTNVSIHYHCKRPRCFFATDSEDEILIHSADFHENFEILDGFLCFDSSVDCRLDNCQSNKISRHFHCVKPGCGFSFIRYSQMLEHFKKHITLLDSPIKIEKDQDTEIKTESTPSIKNNSSPLQTQSLNVSNNNIAGTQTIAIPSTSPETLTSRSTTVVKASGTFYPLCGLTNARSSSPLSNASAEEKPKIESIPEQQSCGGPLPMIPEWLQLERHDRYTIERPCCRAFCKLKRKEHYHCNACNQAFSELDKLKPHILKHNSASLLPFSIKQENNNNNENSDDIGGIHGAADIVSSKGLGIENAADIMSPHAYSANFGAAMAAAQHFALMTSQGLPFISHGMPTLYSSPSGLMFAAPPGFNSSHHSVLRNGLLEGLSHVSPLSNDCSNSDLAIRRSASPQTDMSPEMKKARIQSSMRILKDEPVPDGYLRFRFNEDCHYAHCGYREHQTHFHCIRQDCGYSFCDKTRFVQHTARHERLDTLMGGDFHQFRANVSCGRNDCVYTATLGSSQNKASHFHCLKCEFVCTDTNKVVAHRRQHQKLDSIMAAGFEKFTPSQACSQPENCVHSGKQTHYHCLSCQYAVLGLSQMTAHKYRHMECSN